MMKTVLMEKIMSDHDSSDKFINKFITTTSTTIPNHIKSINPILSGGFIPVYPDITTRHESGTLLKKETEDAIKMALPNVNALTLLCLPNGYGIAPIFSTLKEESGIWKLRCGKIGQKNYATLILMHVGFAQTGTSPEDSYIWKLSWTKDGSLCHRHFQFTDIRLIAYAIVEVVDSINDHDYDEDSD